MGVPAWFTKKDEKKVETSKITHCPYKGCGMSSTSVRHVQQHMRITHGEG